MSWAPDYVEVGELASYLRIDDPVDDTELALAISAASRAIDNAAGRQFGLIDSPEERIYTARYDYERGRWVVDVDDFQTAVGMVVTVDGTAVTVFDREPRNAAAKGRPWTRLVFSADSEAVPSCAPYEVAATIRWGWATFPPTVEQATLLQASRFFTRRNAPFGVAGSPDVGSEVRLLAKVDPDVAVSLTGYRRARSPL